MMPGLVGIDGTSSSAGQRDTRAGCTNAVPAICILQAPMAAGRTTQVTWLKKEPEGGLGILQLSAAHCIKWLRHRTAQRHRRHVRMQVPIADASATGHHPQPALKQAYACMRRWLPTSKQHDESPRLAAAAAPSSRSSAFATADALATAARRQRTASWETVPLVRATRPRRRQQMCRLRRRCSALAAPEFQPTHLRAPCSALRPGGTHRAP